MFCFRYLINQQVTSKIHLTNLRYLYGVRHDIGVFYVMLPHDKTNDRAVLLYKRTGNVLDMYSVKVPRKYQGRGLGRLLAEAAFTYVIVYNYRMYLSCTYLQKYYETIKTQDLSVYVVGPANILGGEQPISMFPNVEADKLEGMPDPTDMENRFNED